MTKRQGAKYYPEQTFAPDLTDSVRRDFMPMQYDGASGFQKLAQLRRNMLLSPIYCPACGDEVSQLYKLAPDGDIRIRCDKVIDTVLMHRWIL